MLTGRNEWIAIGALIVYIAFVPCPYSMKEFFSSPIGKVIALSAVIYAWKFVSMPVAVLLLVAFLRSGAVREYLEEETGVTAPSDTDYKCPDEFIYDTAKKMCMKGTEVRMPECTDSTMTWNPMDGKCAAKPESTPSPSTSSSAGPPGGTTPGAMAAKNAMANTIPTVSLPVSEAFSPYAGKDKEFAPL